MPIGCSRQAHPSTVMKTGFVTQLEAMLEQNTSATNY